MLFKNIETGVVWNIQDETHIKRCSNDPNYETVKEKKVELKKDEPKQETKKPAPKKKATTKKKSTTK